MDTKELREKRAPLAEQIRELAELANDETHKWSPADESKWKKINRQYDGLTAQIKLAAEEDRDVDAEQAGMSGYTGIETRDLPSDDQPAAYRKQHAKRPIAAFDEWRTMDGKALPVFRPEQRMADFYDPDGSILKDVNVGNLIRAFAARNNNGLNAAERRALTGLTAGSGGVSLSPAVSARIWDLAREQSKIVQAGARVFPMDAGEVKIARLETAPTVYWRAPGVAITESDPTFSGTTLKARTGGCLFKIGNELLADAVDFGNQIANIVSSTMGQELDRVCLDGDGAAEEPLGLLHASGTAANAAVGVPTNHDEYLDSLGLVEAARGRNAFLMMHPRDWLILAKLKCATTNDPMRFPEMLEKVPLKLSCCNLPITDGAGTDESSAINGDASSVIIGVRAGIDLEFATQESFSEYVTILRAVMRLDCAIGRPTDICVSSGIKIA